MYDTNFEKKIDKSQQVSQTKASHLHLQFAPFSSSPVPPPPHNQRRQQQQTPPPQCAKNDWKMTKKNFQDNPEQIYRLYFIRLDVEIYLDILHIQAMPYSNAKKMAAQK